MFDTVRNHSKIMMGVLFVLIIPSFVLFGIEGYSRFGDSASTVARVDGQKITQQQWDEAHKREVDRIRARSPNVDAQLLDSPQAKQATLEQLIDERVLDATAQKQNLLVSDARLMRELQQIPAIAELRGADGKLDMVRYRDLLAPQGLSPEGFEARVRQELSGRQVLAPVQSAALQSNKQADTAMEAWLQRREVQIETFAAKDFAGKVQVTEADLEAYHKAHAEQFRSQESVDVEYAVLDLQSLMTGVTLPEQDLKTYYEQNLQRLAGAEQRRASHILVAVTKDAPAAEREKAKAQAQSLLDQARKAPKSFAELARKHSQDPGSAPRGGDLDFFARGAMVKAFEDAVFAMKEGEISELVESDFGYHIIELTAIKQPKVPSFESMRGQIEVDLRKEQAQRKFAELADVFSNGVYEQADTLKPVAEKLKLTLKQAKGVTRVPTAQLPAELAHPKVLQALFSEDATVKRRNTEAVEIGNNTLVSARVVQHQPAQVRAFSEVRDQVRLQYVQSKAVELASKEGQSRLAAAQANPDARSNSPALVISRDQTQLQAQALVDAVLRADPKKLPAWVGVDLGAQGYAVVRVNQLVPRQDQKPEQTQAMRQQFSQLLGLAQTQAYMAALKKALKVELIGAAGKAK